MAKAMIAKIGDQATATSAKKMITASGITYMLGKYPCAGAEKPAAQGRGSAVGLSLLG